MVDKSLFDRVTAILQGRNGPLRKLDVLQSLNEELGEYTRATRIEDGTKKGDLAEPAKSEVIDIMLTGIEAYILSGGTYDEMSVLAEGKIKKWEDKVRSGELSVPS
jgi:hypothetical protein